VNFTCDERRMLILYHSGSLDKTVDTLRLALQDITDPDERASATNALRKLDEMDEASFQGLIFDCEGLYDG